MGTFTKGDIVLFPFPYTDLSERKIRPCLILSEEMGEDIILCQITSQQTRRDAWIIDLRHNETLGGSLSIDSYIRTNMIFTATKAQIHGRLCSISDAKYSQIVRMIERIISKPA